MPADSQAQRKLMAIAEHHPEDVSAKNRGVLSMDKDQLHDFASTKEKGLPEHAKKKGGDGPVDHKAALSKMNPEHLHHLVEQAHSGKLGPAAQHIAQMAMTPQGDNNDDNIAGDSTTTPGGRNYSAIFSGGPNRPADGDSDDMTQPVSRAAMFRGGR